MPGLQADYQATREDQRAALTIQFQAVGFALVALSLLANLGSHDCRVNLMLSSRFYWTHPLKKDCGASVQDPILALSSAIPLAIMTLLFTIGTRLLVVSFYERELEAELRRRTAGDALDRNPPLFGELEAMTNRMNGASPGGSAMTILEFLAMLAAYAWEVVVLRVVDGWWKSLPVTFLAMTMYLTFVALRMQFYGRDYYATWRQGVPRPPGMTSELMLSMGRRLAFLLLPRRGADLVPKFLFYVLGIFLAYSVSLAGGGLWRGILVVLVAEFVVYQGRYLVNDLATYSADRSRPDAQWRRRLAHFYPDYPQALRAVVVSLILRLCVVVFVMIHLWRSGGARLALELLSFGVLVILAAHAYDRTRARAAGDAATKRIFLLVGLGYPLRAVLGFAVLSGSFPPVDRWTWLFLMAVAFPYSFGISFVALTYTLNGVAMTNLQEAPAVEFDPSSNSLVVRRGSAADQALASLSHYRSLLGWNSRRWAQVGRTPWISGVENTGPRLKYLQGGEVQRARKEGGGRYLWLSPGWQYRALAGVFAHVAVLLASVSWIARRGSGHVWWVGSLGVSGSWYFVVALLAGAVGALVLNFCRLEQKSYLFIGILSWLAAVPTQMFGAPARGDSSTGAWTLALAALALVFVMVYFRLSSHESLNRGLPVRKFLRWLISGSLAVFQRAVGDPAMGAPRGEGSRGEQANGR